MTSGLLGDFSRALIVAYTLKIALQRINVAGCGGICLQPQKLEGRGRRIELEGQSELHSETLSQKTKGWSHRTMVEHWPSKCKTLDSFFVSLWGQGFSV